jgi:hypothetical protein
MHVHRVDAHGLRAAQMVQRTVASDPVQPRPDVDLPLVGEDRVERRREDLLEHVLGVLLRGEHVAAEREQPRLVAGHERLEGVRAPAPHERDQALVGLQAQQRRAPVDPGKAGGVLESGSFHVKGSRPRKLQRVGKVARKLRVAPGPQCEASARSTAAG